MEITSLTNTKIKQWAKYEEKKYRDADQKFLIEGEHLLQEAHTAGLIECILVEQGKNIPYEQYPVYYVTREILKKLTDSVSGSWVMAVCHFPEQQALTSDKIIILDGVQDPGNLGTILRTALSFSYQTILLSKNSVDVYNEKVIRSTQGALFHLNIIRTELLTAIEELKEKGYKIYGTSLHEAIPLSQVHPKKRHALIMGNEGKGVREEILCQTDQNVYIEMDTFESLNVAVAAAICMYTFKNK